MTKPVQQRLPRLITPIHSRPQPAPESKQAGVKLHVPPAVDVKEVRRRAGLTQEQLAAKFAISVGTLRHWEREDRTPRGATLVLLNIIAKEPKAVMRALEAA